MVSMIPSKNTLSLFALLYHKSGIITRGLAKILSELGLAPTATVTGHFPFDTASGENNRTFVKLTF